MEKRKSRHRRKKIRRPLWLIVYIGYVAEQNYEKMYQMPDAEDISSGTTYDRYSDDAQDIAAVYRDIYDEAAKTNTLGSLETMRCIISRLGENGYVAVDSENQVDMAGAEQAVEFCKAVDEKENAELTIIKIEEMGFRKQAETELPAAQAAETTNGTVSCWSGDFSMPVLPEEVCLL